VGTAAEHPARLALSDRAALPLRSGDRSRTDRRRGHRPARPRQGSRQREPHGDAAEHRDPIGRSDLDKTDADAIAAGQGYRFAYQGWGFANGRWAWGNEPTTISNVRQWGEICFRAMGGKYVLSWFQPNRRSHALEDIRAQVFPLPTSDLFAGTEQTMVYSSGTNPSSDRRQQLESERGVRQRSSAQHEQLRRLPVANPPESHHLIAGRRV
jgi:hypothetical protein